MIALDAQALFAIAAVISSMSSLIWSIRMNPAAGGPDLRVAAADPGRPIGPANIGHSSPGAEDVLSPRHFRRIQPRIGEGLSG